MTSEKSICKDCGAALREHESRCKNCSSTAIQDGNTRSAELGSGFWISAIVGLITSFFIGGFAIFGDAGSTTPPVAATVIVGGIAIQIGSWYLGRSLIRRGHHLAAWLLLAIPFVFALFLAMIAEMLISRVM